jgi:hypothetical protein
MGHVDKDAPTEQELLLKSPSLYMENTCVEILLHVKLLSHRL